MITKPALSLLCGCLLISSAVSGQIDFESFIDDSNDPFNNLREYPDIKFAWNMPGRQQVLRSYYRSVLGDFKGAFEDINEMIRIQPKSDMAYRLRGEIKFNYKDYYGCIVDLTRFLKSDSLKP